MDINQPKSRSFNMYLRFFQMGLQVLIASKISQINSNACEFTFQKVGFIITLLIIIINLISMIVIRCTHHFARIFFFLTFILNLILAAIIVILSIVGLAQYNSCANNRVLYRFAMMQGIISILISFMIVFLPFHWIQRYSNTPGNIAWIILFFGFGWSSQYKVSMIIEGAIYSLISLMSFALNMIACKGITTQIKKGIVVQWIFSSILMIVGQALAVVVYLQSNKNEVFVDNIALKLLQTFICVNILDLLFWLWGYLTLQYENGDKIRDELMRWTNDEDASENVEQYHIEDHHENPAFGTIRR